MNLLRYKIIYNSKLIRKVENYFAKLKRSPFPSYIPAMVWDGNEVHVRGTWIGQTMLNHELIHLAQINQVGFRQYLNKYFIEEKDIPYGEKETEVEAYMHQHNPRYLTDVYGLIPILEDEIYEQL